ncbi:MAG: DMT family transporter [Chloroflexota bacterium]|nr:DMT family transporter [Chloroflexota bacterium]
MLLLGEAMAFAAAVGFAVSSFYLRLGQQQRPNDDGVLTLNAINLCVNVPLAILFALLHKLPAVVLGGVLLVILGGILTSFLGRIFWLRSIRLIGPARATSLEGTNPLFATLVAVLALGERLPALGWFGVCLAILGILLLGQENRSRKPALATEGPKPAPATEQGTGFAFGLISAISFGIGAAVRRAALLLMPSPFVAAPISSLTAFVGMFCIDVSRPNGGWARVRHSVLHPPAGFVLAGVITAVAQLLNFGGLDLAPVSRVAVINATQPVLAVLIGAAIFRQHDSINRRVFVAALLIVSGIALVVFR